MLETTLSAEVQAAEADIAAGHPEAALARCRALLERYPRALVVQRVQGEAHLAQRQPREALACLERALAGDPEDARACCARAVVHQIHGDPVAALAWYGRACDIRPEDANLLDAYRELAARVGQPPYEPSAVGLARLYLRGDLFDHAVHEWETVLAQQPDRLDAQLGLAETLWRAGDTARARDVARRLVANAASCVKALLILAALEHAAGREQEADRLLQRAAEFDPERRIGRTLYADLFAAGDAAFEARFRGEAGARATAAPADLVVTSPAFDADATARLGTVSGGAASSGAALGAARENLQAVGALAQSGMHPVPPDFHQIFKETENMLWFPEDEDAPPAASRPGAAPPAEAAPRPERSPRTAPTPPDVPPALARVVESMGDTESRAAVGFVRWLQAQGARAAGAAPAGSTGAPARGAFSGALPDEVARPPDPESNAQPGLPPHDLPPQPGTGRFGPTMPLSALRASASLPAVAPGSPAPEESAPEPPAASWPAGDADRPPAADELASYPGQASWPASGVHAVDPPATPDYTAGADSAIFAPAAEPAAQVGAVGDASRPPWHASEGYLDRLRLARRHRAEGRVDDALLEYRTLLHDVPEALDDLIHDLRDLGATSETPEVFRLLGDAYIREGDYVSALESYNRALALGQGRPG